MCGTTSEMGQKPAKSLKDAPTVVIVGAGYAGKSLAKQLDSVCNVVLIERKDYFLHNIGAPRGMVDPEFMKKCLIPYTPLLKNGHVIQGQVEKVTDTEIHMQGQDKPISGFDYLVLATGTSYSFPYKVPEAELEKVMPLYNEIAEKIKHASNIVCVGGGSTGLEAATEIADVYKDKKVTLIHSRAAFFDDGTFKPAYGAKLLEHIGRGFPNVQVIMEDRLKPVEADGGENAAQQKFVEPASKKVTTEKGVEIDCDLLFWCVGGRQNSASYSEHFAEKMDKRGVLKVDEFLQVEGHPKVFAAGDICGAGPLQTVVYASAHADTIAKNIQLLMKGNKMKPYAPGRPLNVTQLGQKMGAGCIPGPLGSQIILGHFPVQKMKWDCFASIQWTDMGFKGPFDQKESTDAGSEHLANILSISAEDAEKLHQGLPVEAAGAVEHT